MGRMENPNPNETIPTPVNKTPDPEEQPANLEQTSPTPVKREPASSEPANLEQTMPTPVQRESGSGHPANLEQTMPTPVQRELASSDPAGPAPSGAASFKVSPDGLSGQQPKPARKRSSLPFFTVLGLAGLVLIAVASGLGGYSSGIEMRKSAERTQIALTIDQQFALGLQDMAEGNYDRARQRFVYIIQVDPNYPGVTEKLADVLLELNTTATPTVAPTPTLTPTPDLRSVEELFAQAQQYMLNSDWTNTIDTLFELRKDDPNYRAVDVDGMMFLSLRNRGIDKILKLADLEGGIYDLALAERFGPIDTEARGIHNWASLYITGASFWDIDWVQAIEYFSQVAPAMPSLRDGSGYTATERYRLALIGYAAMLAGQEQWCDAQAQYELALSFGPDEKAAEALDEVSRNCAGISDEQPPVEEPPPFGETPTLTPEGGLPPQETPPAGELPTLTPEGGLPPQETPPAGEIPTSTPEGGLPPVETTPAP